ncbi:hypothetical protein BpHYR1_044718 [Brachionus plicatilis]|uniref:Uncharacterized protein n=1 Tax=Brachionus plicatilis TaxID=10195 RepID=A0A3M7T1V7_BRAPC|nr:hypothetical protein BpHYR1_044718 [Brachionus plicatilis]
MIRKIYQLDDSLKIHYYINTIASISPVQINKSKINRNNFRCSDEWRYTGSRALYMRIIKYQIKIYVLNRNYRELHWLLTFDSCHFIIKQNRKPIVSPKYSSNQNAGLQFLN